VTFQEKEEMKIDESKEASTLPAASFLIFLFVNPKSGSRKGKLLLNHNFEAIKLCLSEN
jgi:hypothetical protein